MSDNQHNTVINVWDPLVRVFHWSLVLFFTLAYFTEDDFQEIHEFSGYAVATLVGFRIIWGFIGTKHAKFTDFVKGKTETVAYLKSMLTGRPRHYVGHNPAGGAMVVALLTALLLTTLAGMSLIAIDGSGPLAGTFVSQLDEHLVKDIHELFANFTVALIALHVTGVMLSSLLHKENLVRSMVTGKKQASDN